jgi:hypothetical protein
MSALQRVAQTHIAAIEGRMENVRRRHESLAKLFSILLDREQEVLAAFAHDYDANQSMLSASLKAVIRSTAIEANKLDQVANVKQKYAVQSMRTDSVLMKRSPLGLVAVLATADDLQYPVDAILSPLIAATAAGNSVVVVLPPKRTKVIELLGGIVRSAFQGGSASCVVEQTDAVTNFLQKHACSNVTFDDLGIPARAENVIIVDANIVNADFYRTKNESAKDIKKLQRIAEAVQNAQKYGDFLIMVSENIFESFKGMLSGGHHDQLIATTSLEHVIAQLSNKKIGHLSCFTTRDFASFYSTNVAARSMSFDSIPLDVIVGYCPTAVGVQRARHDDTGFQLEPMWDVSLFTKLLPIISVRCQPNDIDTSKLAIVPMKRRHVSHWEFFPTGFVITFFPTLASLVGFTGFLGYKVALNAYRMYAS